MSVDDVDAVGFISKSDFDEGCQALQQLGLTSRQTAPTIEVREEVNWTNIIYPFQL